MITLRDRDRIARWLFQLLAYAWLDEVDRYGIRNVGLYLARHGVLLIWPLDAFAENLVNVPGCVVPLVGSSSTTPTTRCTSKVRCRSPSPATRPASHSLTTIAAAPAQP